MVTLRLKKREDRRLRRGHPWAFSNEIETPLSGIEPGQMVTLADHEGRPVGTGYANPRSLIAVRLVARAGEEFGPDTVLKRVLDAKALRERLCPGREAYRAFYSESDFLPGLVVDRYGGWLSVQSLTAGIERLMPEVLSALDAAYSPEGIVLRNDTRLRELEGLPLEKKAARGELTGPVEVAISGLRFRVDLIEGQKTGFFLDQVDNYRLLDGICAGEDVLDLFCHTGAWALKAAAQGAASCTGVDSSATALAGATENAELNGLSGVVRFIRDEALTALKGFAAAGRRFGVVVCDPPAFVKGRARLAEGIRGYRDLNTRAMKAVRPGGWLITCSCSHHVDRAAFMEVLRQAASGSGRTVRVIETRSQSRDHPALLAAPETEYLKCVLLQVP